MADAGGAAAPHPREDRVDGHRPSVEGRPRDGAAPGRARLAAAFGVLSAVVCLIGSWHVSLWKDEVDSISASTRGLDGLWRLLHHIDAVHGIYYLTLELWTSVAGRSEFAVRFPSAVAAGLATAGVVVLADRMCNRRVAVYAAVSYLTLPRVTWMGIEARPFAYTAAAGVWLTVLFVAGCDAERGDARRRWAGYAVLAAVGVAVNVYVALLVVAHGVGLLLARPPRRRLDWLGAAVAAAVLSSPVVITALGQRGQLGDTRLGAVQTVRSIVINQWFLGNTPNPNGQEGGSFSVGSAADLWRVAGPLLALLAWVLVIVAVLREWRMRRLGATDPIPVLVPAVVLPTVLVAVYSLAVSPMYSARYFCFTAFAVAVFVGMGVDALGRRSRQIAAIAAVVVLAAPIYASQRTATGKGSDWSAAAAFVAANSRPGQGVYFTPRFVPTAGTKTVGSTSRYIATAYPDDFRGLRDVTLLRTGPQDESLTGVSQLLPNATTRLRGLDTVWVLRRLDYPAAAARADDIALNRAGFRASRTWTGSVDTVIEFVR